MYLNTQFEKFLHICDQSIDRIKKLWKTHLCLNFKAYTRTCTGTSTIRALLIKYMMCIHTIRDIPVPVYLKEDISNILLWPSLATAL